MSNEDIEKVNKRKEKMGLAQEVRNIIAQSTGSETFYRHWVSKNTIYTNGVDAIATKANAYWLVDDIIINSLLYQKITFQVWELKVDIDKETAILTLYDDTKKVKDFEYSFTTFPCDIKFYLIDDTVRWTLLLPQEY